MPVIHVDRDPVLISIDRQRLEDLGIPSVPAHECVANFYGPLSIMRPVLIVPEGWEEALPDELPVQEEWNDAEWETACNDDSNERPEHTRPIVLVDYIGGAAVAMLVLWTTSSVALILTQIALLLIPTGGRRAPVVDGNLADVTAFVGILIGFVAMVLGILFLSPVIGTLAWASGWIMRNATARCLIIIFLFLLALLSYM